MSRRSFGRIRTHRSGRWSAAYTGPDGRLYRAPHTFARKIDAEGWLVDRRRELDRELWSPPPTPELTKAKKRAGIRFEDYAETWVATRLVKGKPLQPRTKAHYRMLLKKHINPTFGRTAVRAISRDAVEAWYANNLLDQPVLRAHSYSLLRTILETARSTNIINTNPCAIRGAGAAERTIKPRPLTVKELDVLVTEMPDRFRAMVLLGVWCAMRYGELVELRRGDIEDDIVKVRRGAVRVGGRWEVGPPKSAAGVRDIVMPPNIVGAIQQHLQVHTGPLDDALLFPAKNGGWLQPSTFQRHFYKAREKAKRPDCRFHDCRHSGAVMAAQTGATLAELMARLGHSSHQAALRYQHQAEGRDRAIAAKMALLAEQPEDL